MADNKNSDIREYKPGDIGWIISKHGEIYAKEFGFDGRFEIDIAKKLVAFFGENRNPFDMLWIAEVHGDRAGSIGISRKTDQKAFINFVLVLDQFRSQKIASKLMAAAMAHCRDYQFKLLELETYDCLISARKLYKKLGFRMASVNAGLSLFGQTLDQEFWELELPT